MTEADDNSPRLTQRLLGAGCLALTFLIVIGVILGIIAAHRTVKWSNQMYAKWHMGYLLTDYLHDNDNQWPESWGQLEDRFDEHYMGGYSYDHRDEIQTGQIKLVWACSGDDSHYERGEPNEIIADYFEPVCSQKDSDDKP
jgi:hypothetical protein